MSLRRLILEIELTACSTGKRAKAEHARLLKGILYMLENPEWAGFVTPLHDTHGNQVGSATLTDRTPRKEFQVGDR